jgi:cysteinyl-tRNA synthetase
MHSELHLYNTLSRSREKFVPLRGNEVKMFVCGQTVYDDAHLGHAKNYIDFDIVARWLMHEHYHLDYIQNITDVDDKIIMRAKEKGITAEELSRNYEERFFEDMESLGVRKNVKMYPRSHDYIKEIASQIQLLADKGYAYAVDGDIYYQVDKFKDYTKLSGMKLDELTEHRIEGGDGKKKQYDFALWKSAKAGEPSWKIKIKIDKKETEFDGRPGWHIEDTAITHAIFGPQYDLHGGAGELIFPHHTNEIAQAEAAFGKKPFVKYWMHTGVLNVEGKKMSKSLKNFITIRDVLKKYEPEAIRLMVASTHYKKEIDYSDRIMKDANGRLHFIYSSFSIFYNMKEKAGKTEKIDEIAVKLQKDFTDAMNDDFDTSLALASLQIAITELRKFAETEKAAGKESKEEAVSKVLEFADILGILEHDDYKKRPSDEVMAQIAERDKLRKDKKFKESDSIRDELKAKHGIILEDTEYGTVWYKEQKEKR